MQAIKYKGRLYNLNDGKLKFRFSKNDPKIKKAASELLKAVRASQGIIKRARESGKLEDVLYIIKLKNKILSKTKNKADKLESLKIAGFYKSILRRGIKLISQGDFSGGLWQFECVYNNLKDGPDALEEAKEELYYA